MQTAVFAWTLGPRGPEPSRCDADAIRTLRKYGRVMIEHPIPDDCADCSLDALAMRFPAPSTSSMQGE